MAKSHRTTVEAVAAMLASKPNWRYEPDLRTPISTLRDAVAMQCERAKLMVAEAMTLRRVA